MITVPLVPSATLAEACDRLLADVGAWVADCIARYTDAPPTDVHDQATYTTGWEPYIRATEDDAALAFMLRLRDDIRDHFVATGQWRHGYWRMQEAHHGTEHFELFLGALSRLAPRDAETTRQLVDAAEHLGNWVPEVAPWFDWDRGLYRSTFFGTDGVRTGPGLAVNVPDHLRCANVALLAHGASGERRFRDLAATYAGRWADAILAGDALPVALTADGPVYALTEAEERQYRAFAGQMPPDLNAAVDRAENLLASDAVGAFLTLWRATGEAHFRLALERLLDVAATQLGDPDAGVAADAIRRYRRATGDRRYDGTVLAVANRLDPWGWRELTLDLDSRPGRRLPGMGKREDMLRWLEDGRPRRHGPILLALAAEIAEDGALAARALDIARAYLAAARAGLPDGRDHGCSSRSVSAVARGNGRENHAGMTTAVLSVRTSERLNV